MANKKISQLPSKNTPSQQDLLPIVDVEADPYVTKKTTVAALLNGLVTQATVGAAGGVASLGNDGKVPAAQLPAIAITTTNVVNSQAAMLALSVTQGAVAIRTDLNKSFILVSAPASTLSNWQELITPPDTVTSVNGQTGNVTVNVPVTSVNGQTGEVVLDAADISGFADVATSGSYTDLTDKPQIVIVAPTWTTNHTLADGTRYLVNDVVYSGGNIYRAKFDNESMPVTNTTYWENLGPGSRLNLDGRDIPNIPFPVTSVNGLTGAVTIETGNPFDQDLNTTDDVNFANLTIGDAATPNVASISAGTGAASFAQGALTVAADGALNIIGNGTITASSLGELYASTNFSVGNQIWLDTTGSYAINVGNGAFYVGQLCDIYGADLAVVGNLSAGNGNFLYDSGANSLGIGALVVADTISAATGAFTVSSSGSVNIGSGNITANAELGDIAASGTIQAGSHLIAGSDINAANGNFFYDGAANSFSVSGTFSAASGVFAVDSGGSLNIGSGNIIADAPSGDLSCSGYFSTAGSAGIDGNLTVGGDINVINTGKIYVQSKEVATKEYVDATKQGLDVKDSVRVATTANITLSGLQTIDGVLVASGDRVLVKNQNTASQNGIYVAAAGSWSRSTDADTSSEVTAGMYAFVSEGTTQADSGWVLTTNDTITLDTTALTFTQFSGAGQITAGDGLTKSGNTLNVVGTSGRIVANADSIDLATVGVAPGTYGSVTVDAYGRVTAGSADVDGGTYA